MHLRRVMFARMGDKDSTFFIHLAAFHVLYALHVSLESITCSCFNAVWNRGSNPCRGANLKVGAWKRLSARFLFHFQSSNTPKFERVRGGWILTVPLSNSPRQLPVPAVCAAPANSAVRTPGRRCWLAASC